MYEVILEAGKFKGIDNLTDPLTIHPGGRAGTYMVVGLNVDIDDEFNIVLRPGYDRKETGNFHSAWSDGNIGYVVKRSDGYLYFIGEDLSITQVVLVDPSSPMQYVYQNGRVYCTNGDIIGYIEGSVFTPLPLPDEYYQRTMVPGHLIEFHRGRLLVARDEMICISEPLMPHYYDIRWGWRTLGSRITMLKSVDGGVFIGTDEGAYFASGQDFLASAVTKITDSPPIFGSASVVSGDEVTGLGINGVVYWSSDEGIWRGSMDGSVKNLTWDHYGLERSPGGSSVFHSLSGFSQYCLIYGIPLEVGDASVDINLTVPHVDGIGV